MVKIHQREKLRAISSMPSPWNAQKPQNLTSFTKSGVNKKENQQTVTEGGQDASACKIPGYSLHALSDKWPETSPDRQMDMPQNGHGWSDQPTEPCTGGKRAFRASDGRTDGQPENKMPPTPKVRGITTKLCQYGLKICIHNVQDNARDIFRAWSRTCLVDVKISENS